MNRDEPTLSEWLDSHDPTALTERVIYESPVPSRDATLLAGTAFVIAALIVGATTNTGGSRFAAGVVALLGLMTFCMAFAKRGSRDDE